LCCVCVCVLNFSKVMASRSRPGSFLSFEGSGRRLADFYGNVGIERILLH